MVEVGLMRFFCGAPRVRISVCADFENSESARDG